jgi:DNA-binding beta-propeller fold protein YncE
MQTHVSSSVLILLALIGYCTAQSCSPGFGSSESAYKIILVNYSCLNLITYGGNGSIAIGSESSVLAGDPIYGNAFAYDGTGAGARFYSPRHACQIPGTDDILVTEQKKIRKVTVSSRVVTTFHSSKEVNYVVQDTNGAGTSASISYPNAVLMSNNAGFFYVSNTLGVRKVTYPSATVSGVTVPGFTSEMSSYQAISPDGNFIIVTEESVGRIHKYNVATSTLSVIAGTGSAYQCKDGVGTAAQFSRPRSPVISRDGLTLYVSDVYNRGTTIRKVDLVTLYTSCVMGTCPGVYSRSDYIIDMVLSPSGKYLICAINSDTSPRISMLKRVDLESNVVTEILPSSGGVYYFSQIVSMVLVPGPPGPCESCTVGKFSLDGSTCNTCPAGSFCTSVSLSPSQCPSGNVIHLPVRVFL